MSRNNYSRQGSYVNGIPTGADTGWVAMVMDDVAAREIDHSAFMSAEKKLLSPRLMRMFRTVFAGQLPDGTLVFVGDNGKVLSITASGQAVDEFVTTGADSPRTIGHLRSAVVVGRTVIAVGMQRQVYVRDEAGQWAESRQGLPAFGEGETAGFEAVAAVSASEVYAAGWGGEIWCFDGGRWRQVDSPTNRIITALCVDGAGLVHGCGRNGLLFSGRGDAWRMEVEVRIPDDLWSLAADGGRLFAASLLRLYCIEGGKVSLVDFQDIEARTFGILNGNRGQLWSIGEKDVLAYDGAAWSRVL